METGNTDVVAYSGEHMPRHIDFWYDVNATDTCIFYDILYVFLSIETTVQRISPNTPQFGLRNLEVWIVLAFGHLHTTAVMCVTVFIDKWIINLIIIDLGITDF